MTDLSGRKYGLLTVLSLFGVKKMPSGSRRMWLCRCECGAETSVAGNNLTTGHTTSCGSKNHQSNYHGMTNTPIYHVWENMIARCTNESHPSWKDYGGRGITVCKEWMDFTVFHNDMRENYRHGLTIDREDNNAGYSKENCRWITATEQQLNTRRVRRLTIGGVTMVAKQWSRKTGVCYTTLLHRLNQGCSPEIAVRP